MGDDGAELIRWSDLQPAPWKNGGGMTREVAAGPEGGTDWDWRVSVADVEQDGPFSAYPGVDRVITLLEGPAMDLAFDRSTIRLAPREPFAFRGEERIDCTVPGGPTRDLNLMTRRGRARGAIAIHDGHSQLLLEADRVHPDGRILLVALEDDVLVRASDAGAEWTLDRYDTVSASRAVPLCVRDGRKVAMISIRSLAALPRYSIT